MTTLIARDDLPGKTGASIVTDGWRKPLDILETARLCHETNRGYCEALGDTSHVRWEDAPGWQRESAVAGVQAIVNDPVMTPEQSHARWVVWKVQRGWMYGTEKDAERKTHPCLVPYGELPAHQRAKDVIFGAIVRAALE